jgi:hypothetical protein
MQFNGGWRYPSTFILLTLILISTITALIFQYFLSITAVELLTLLTSLLGISLTIGAISPVGWKPRNKLEGFLPWLSSQANHGVPVCIDLRLLFLGAISSMIAVVIGYFR